MPGARRLVLALDFRHPILGRQHFASQTLFGADEVVGSLRLIQPNEALLIRAEESLELNRAWNGSPTGDWAHDVKIVARVILAVPSSYYPIGTSENDVHIALRNR